jgi:uncharacterized protein (TIGR02145 family)
MKIHPDGFTTTIFLPASGNRSYNDGRFFYQGGNGYYWSASATGTNVYCLLFDADNVFPANSGSHTSGFAVRCIKNT